MTQQRSDEEIDRLEAEVIDAVAGALYAQEEASPGDPWWDQDTVQNLAELAARAALAVPALLAAARAVQRVEALLEKAESDQWWVRTVDGGKPPAIMNADQVRAALGTAE